jgi:putative membrane protein
MPSLPLAAAFAGLHLGEFLPPVIATFVYLTLYHRRMRTLTAEGRPVAPWRAVSFASGVMGLAIVQLPPLDTIADRLLVAHMIQHIIIGDICSLLAVLGLTGPVLAPLLRIRFTRPLRTLSSPLLALVLWAADLYAWHVPFFYEAAIRIDLVHAAEHACLFWFGSLLWLALIGPLPKPAWFRGWAQLGYVIGVRILGAILANVFIWAQTVFYPTYESPDASRGLSPLTDQNLAGGVMMVEQVLLTTVLLGWIFYRLALREERRQSLLDLARDRGMALADARAATAADAGEDAGERLRTRILEHTPPGT